MSEFGCCGGITQKPSCTRTFRLLTMVQGASEADAQALEGLLSPQGLLFKAMLSADAESLINFIFPLERLPTRTQLLLRSAPGRSGIL